MLRRIDWSAPAGAWTVAALSFLVRLPNALAGLGFDGDSGLFVARTLLSIERGVYTPSRAPGYFVPEMLARALAGHGIHWLCLLNSAIYALSVVAFAAVLRTMPIPGRNWLLWAYALLPLGWVACSDVMVEYSLCLLGVLLGLLFTLRGAPAMAGVALGCGVAMRPSQGILIFLAFVAYWLFFWRGRAGLTAVALSLASLILLWAMPVVALTGKLQTLWGFMLHEANWRQHLTLAGSRVIGAVGAIGMLAIVLASVDALRALRSSTETFKPALLCLLVSGVILVAFLRHPVKMNYLLLAMPFGLLGVSLLCRPALVALLCLALIVHNGVGIPSLGRISTRYEMRPVGWGIAVRDYQERSAFPHQVESVVAQAPPHSVVGVQESTVWLLAYQTLTGQRAGWRVENPNEVIDATTQRRFVLMGDAASAERWRQQAHPVYITSGVAIRLQNSFNYDPRKVGFRVIPTVNVGL